MTDDMNNPTSAPEAGAPPSRDEIMSALFAQLVMQNSNMAMIFLGLAPNPQTGKTAQDLENARYFIDQLEMLEVKTKGNLNKHEEALLKQSLAHLRMAFVEAVNQPQAAPPPPPADSSAAAPATDEQETPLTEPVLPGEKAAPSASAESRKIFSKKYS
jgi:hypothetical protein